MTKTKQKDQNMLQKISQNRQRKERVKQRHKDKKVRIIFGGAGYRSRYLSHAKRALYHLSYAPSGWKLALVNPLTQNRFP